ncbi:hypothetical protein SAMN05444166_6129 [Singulisphaera sp. GP187]|uniref:hypothetical protein n=1 Tax=Singulisphaera sp. GP187 TaxID=1882752 RepID=UPI0009285DDF|nr:hypothetical protein [Singulisphaera sp. GP187]SIO59650.1 hypothetical protein SAMN05444166_6129 [Singulisphaera sp. GP187]
MNQEQETLRKLDRLLNQLDRKARRPRSRFPMAAIYLTLALILGYQLLVRFVPMVWSTLLPGGWAQAETLSGWPGLIYRLGWICHTRFEAVCIALGGISLAGFVLSFGPWPARLVVWLAAVGFVLVDAGIVFVAIMTCLNLAL